MAYTGIFATEDELNAKAGENVDVTGWTEDNKNAWMKQAESYINVLSRINWSDNFGSLGDEVKGILSEASSNLVAIYGIKFNFEGFTGGRIEAEDMINILFARFVQCIELLRDDRSVKFLNDIVTSTSGPLTTKGDLLTFDTANVRLPVGTDGQVLVADSGESTGLRWSAGGGAPVDSVFGRTGVVVAVTNDYTWAQIDKTTSDIADIASRSHTDLTDIGTNAHSVIDTHLASTSNPHSVTATQVGKDTAQWNADEIQGVTVDDTDIGNGKVLQFNSTSGNLEYESLAVGGDMTAAVYDPASITEQLVGLTATQTLTNKTLTTPTIASFLNANHDHADAAGGGTIDHTDLTTIGTNTHAQLDTHVADSTIHYTQANITAVGTIVTGVWNGTALLANYVPDHDNLNGFVANEHIDWTSTSSNLETTGTLQGNEVREIATETAGESVVNGDLVYLKSDGKYWKTDADAIATSKGRLAIAQATISADATGLFMFKGKQTTSGLTTADELFISVTPGTITNVQPTGSGDIVRLIGYSLSTTVFFFDPDKTPVEVV